METKSHPVPEIADKRPEGMRGIEGFGWVHKTDLISRRNPQNWRKHPSRQKETLETVLFDPDIGWAGVLLLNLTTDHLIDGHLRAEIDLGKSDLPDWLPVCYGHWSESAEKKILLTLDPIASMATEDAKMLRLLSDEVTAGIEETLGGMANRDFVHDLAENLREDAVLASLEEGDPAEFKPDDMGLSPKSIEGQQDQAIDSNKTAALLENVLDLFGGSGSTLIGAEQTGRKAFLMELDPLYCDVIVQRWEKLTGKKASRLPKEAPSQV